MTFTEFIRALEELGGIMEQAKEDGLDRDDGTSKTPRAAQALYPKITEGLETMTPQDFARASRLLNGAGIFWTTLLEPGALATAAIRMELEGKLDA